MVLTAVEKVACQGLVNKGIALGCALLVAIKTLDTQGRPHLMHEPYI